MFKESGSSANTTDSKESIKEATERLRKENEEKIRKMKEEREKREKGSSEKKEEERKQKQERYSQEFQEKPLNVDGTEPKHYTKEMRDADLGYITEWIDFEIGKIGWLKDELVLVRDRKYEVAFTLEQKKEVMDWFYQNIQHLNNQIQEKRKEYQKIRKRIVDTYVYKRDPKKEEEDIKRKREEEKKCREAEERKKQEKEKERKKKEEESRKKEEEDRKKREEKEKGREKPGGGAEDGPRKPSGGEMKKAEQIAIQELGITFAEYKAITSNIDRLNDGEMVRLITKVLRCHNEKNEIKKAYRRWAKEWHPDSRKTKFGIGVNEVKFKIANNLFGEYNKRFEK